MRRPTAWLLLGLGLGALSWAGSSPEVRAAPSPRAPLADRRIGIAGGVEVRQWTYLSQGLRVRGRLYLPPSPTQKTPPPPNPGRWPLILFNHDGVSGISREHHLSSLRLAGEGFVVFCPSYRGEDGSEGQVEIARGEVEDVLSALPLLRALPQVDGARAAMVGASHGALVSLLATARDPGIRALVWAYGVSDLYAWWDHLRRTGQLGRDPLTLRTYGEGPQDRPESFALRHGLSRLPKVKAPVLILQGVKDEIVPPDQARRLHQGLQRAGVPTRLCLYPDALHGFLVYAPYLADVSAQERAQTEEAWATMLAFLREHLGER